MIRSYVLVYKTKDARMKTYLSFDERYVRSEEEERRESAGILV